MSIDRTQPLKPVATVQTRESNESTTGKTRQASNATATTPAAAQVSLSNAQSQLTQPGSQDINVAGGVIYDALIADTKAYLEGK